MKSINIKNILLNTDKPAKVLIVRNDGLGDFILTLPLIASIKAQAPQAKIYVLIHKAQQMLIPLLCDIEGAIIDEGILLKRHRNVFTHEVRDKKTRDLESEIKSHHFDLAVLVYAEAATAALIHRAGVPVRVGSIRRPFFWRFNTYYRFSRKKSDESEYSLNLRFLNTLGLKPGYVHPSIRSDLKDIQKNTTSRVILHPIKRNKTAAVWAPENFISLANELQKLKCRVIAIGDDVDREELLKLFKDIQGVEIITSFTLEQLFEFLREADFFIGNSSGPLHVAALAGTAHIGFYPPERPVSRNRWKTLPIENSPDYKEYLIEGSVSESNPRYLASIEVGDVIAAMESWQSSFSRR